MTFQDSLGCTSVAQARVTGTSRKQCVMGSACVKQTPFSAQDRLGDFRSADLAPGNRKQGGEEVVGSTCLLANREGRIWVEENMFR